MRKSKDKTVSTSKVSYKSMSYRTIRDTRQFEIPGNTRYQDARDTRKYDILTNTR